MKRHLLFALAMLFATVGFAQKDITSQYITNAKLDQSFNVGWTTTNFNGDHTQGNNTVGYAVESYAGWGTVERPTYSMVQTITLPKGHYRLVNYSFYRYGERYDIDDKKSEAYLKAGSDEVSIVTLGSIEGQASYANTMAEAANRFETKMYRNFVEFNIESDNTNIEIGVYGTHSEPKSWFICGMFELFDLDDVASVSSPTDVTYKIKNSGFEYLNLKEWTNSITQGNNQYSGGNNFDPKSGYGFYESWKNGEALGDAGTFTQTLANMPAGLYELSVYAQNIEQYNGNAGGTGMFLTANNDKAEIGAQGLYKVRTTLAQDGNLTVGISLEGCTGNWIAIDRFGLQFYGDPLAAYQDLLDEAVAEAEALVTSGTLPSSVAADLQQIIDDNNNDDDAFTTEAEFNEAINKINTAIKDAKAFVLSYAAWLEMKAKADELVAVANDNTEANEAFSNAIETQEQNVDEATTTDAIEAATAALKDAMITYAGEANPEGEGAQFDLTFMLTNPDLTPYWDGTWWIQPEGWYKDQTDGNFQVMNNGDVNNPNAPGKDIFMEYYYLNNNTTYGNNVFNIYTKVTLPEGTYAMNCYAFAREQNYSSGNPNPQVYFYANDTQGSCVTSNILAPQSISFVNDKEQEVKIGLKPQEGNTYNWMGIGYVQLFKVPAKAFEIDEAVAYDNTQEGAGDVTLTRTIKAGMNTVVLPFQMTAADIEILGGEGAVARTVSEYLPASEDFSFAEVTEVPANQPFFLYATVASADREDGNVFTFKGKTLVAGEPKAEVGDLFTLVGTYAVTAEVPVSTPEKRNFILNGGKFYNVDSEGVSIHNTRCYIEINIPSIAINEGETFENTQTYKYANVTLTRTIKEGMNTVVVPFELTAEDIAAIGGEGAVAYTVSGYANDNLKFATAETVAANIPFFLNATEATSGAGEFAFEGKKVVAGDPIVKVSEDCSLFGTYKTTPVPVSNDNGSYYILSGGKFYTVDSEGVTIKNTRFYVATSAPAGANTLGFTFDGEANAINGIIANDNAPEGIYNLQGQKVEKATKGIYIINGKKVLVK